MKCAGVTDVFALMRSFFTMMIGDACRIGSVFIAGLGNYSDIYCMQVRDGDMA